MSDGNPFIAFFNEHADYGVAYGRTFTWEDENGDPIPTTGFTVQAKLRPDFASDPVLTFTGTVGGADGTVSITATAVQMAVAGRGDVSQWDGVYDVLLISGGQAVTKLVRGTFSIHPTASR